MFVEADGEFWTAGLPGSAVTAERRASPSLPPSKADSTAAAAAAAAARGSSRTDDAATAGGGGGGGGAEEGRVVSLKEAREAFQRGGFSLVINRLQRRWRAVWRVSRALEDVLGQPVNANLYMTPPRSQGFEAHFDWMDGAYPLSNALGKRERGLSLRGGYSAAVSFSQGRGGRGRETRRREGCLGSQTWLLL